MKPLDDREFQARLDAISNGPWSVRAQEAKKRLSPLGFSVSGIVKRSQVNLDDVELGPRGRKQVDSLARILKWHGDGRIPTRTERRIRDSVDDALTQFQMIELAIETGYLPADQVSSHIREDFIALLWSSPARKFVNEYEYSSIESLAHRLNIEGFGKQPPRPIDPSGSVYFATFLATHRAIERDTDCEAWLWFLDDYVVRANEQNDFLRFLRSGNPARSIRRQQLIRGARNFSVMLADFLTLLPERLKGRFAAFYAYWLAKTYGYRKVNRRYTRNVDAWGESGDDNWANALLAWYSQDFKKVSAESGNEAEIQLFIYSMSILEDAWSRVRSGRIVAESDNLASIELARRSDEGMRS